jgi:SAM-dependent methyltransferase
MCDVCGGGTTRQVCDWTFWCPACGLWQSTLASAIESEDHALSEEHRVEALQPIRRSNFDRILARLSSLIPLDGQRLLEVGCGHGWFLAAAAARGMQVRGIEPDGHIAEQARSLGLPVLSGYFPGSLGGGERFDVLVFNDVLEHISGVHSVLAASAAATTTRGLLVLSVPTSAGTLFRLARGLAVIGVRGPWDRLWQTAFPSPHVYYFNRSNLDLALRRHGFSAVHREGTDVFRPKGLWARMRFDRNSSLFVSAVLYAGLLLLYPWYLMFGRADTDLLIYQRAGAAAADSHGQ